MEKIIIFGVEIEPPSYKKKKEEASKRADVQFSIGRFHVVIDFMAKQNHWRFNNMRKYILNLAEIDRATAIRLILKKAALMFDEKYPDHISKAEEVYLIDEYTSNDIIPCQPELYRIVPLFRNKQEAEWALSAIKPLLKDEQED